MVEPVGIGGKDSAVNLKIAVHNGLHQFIHRVSGTIGQIPRAPLAHTGISPTMAAPEVSMIHGSFQLGTAMGQPERRIRGLP